MILDGFGSHFGSNNGTKMVSKIDQKIDGFLGRSWEGSLARKGGLTGSEWSVLGPRGRVGKG